MKEQLISFEVAILAKQKGFKPSVSNSIYNEIGELKTPIDQMDLMREQESLDDYFELIKSFPNAPTQHLLQKWLREVHNIYIDCYFRADIINSTKVIITKINYKIYDWSDGEKVKSWDVVFNKSYPLMDSKYEFNISKYSDDDKYRVKTYTYEDALEIGLIEALKLIP